MATTYGFANVTGGEGAPVTRVTNSTGFLTVAQNAAPAVIEVQGTITLPLGMNSIQSNKTIIGVGTTAKIMGGGLYFNGRTNVIIKNLTFTGQNDDCIAISNSTNILVTNCDLSSAGDGLLDINLGSSYITVCWNRFSNHDFTSLVGHSDSQTSDRGRLKVTYHHNWFDGVDQRMPRVRYGEVHVYNNYYRGNNSLYALGVGVEAKIYSENNYFENIPATMYLDSSSQRGYALDVGSHFVNSTGTWRPSGVTWRPTNYYSYPLEVAADVKTIVMAGAGITVQSTVDPTPNAYIINPLSGMKLLNFGDSIGVGSGNGNVSYANLIATRNNMILNNRAIDGAIMANTNTNNIITQVTNAIGQAADYIIFNGLTNDIADSNNVPLGILSSGWTATLNLATFSGAFEHICKTLKTNWPDAKILYIRPHSMPITSRNLQRQIDYGNRAIEICRKWSIPYVDMYSEGGLNTNVVIMRDIYTNNADGTHPNLSGYSVFYVPIIESKLRLL